MKEFDFTLKFSFAQLDDDAADYVEQLGAAGCDDALIGIGQKGRVALQFLREADNANDAVLSAIEAVKSVIADAKLVEAAPDLVGLSDIAELLGFSRQNMRKLMLTHQLTFPAPMHEGKSAIWHLAKVLVWFEANQNKSIDPVLLETAHSTMQLNIGRGVACLDQPFAQRVGVLMV
ncbi:MAG: hypothetical protein ACI8WB_003380 [Phenylobacterium sp.]|jgi:hypothetical protein